VRAGGNWAKASVDLKRELRERLDAERLRLLHRPSPALHLMVTARQLLLGVLAGWGIVAGADRWYVWLPCAALLGFVVFSFTVLLHEVVHRAVFARRGHPANRLLAWLYALPAGLSPSQFTRWHLDHHAELGDPARDPKRHHLTPRIVRRWYKLLYCTPALFPIYFRAAAREAATYEPAFRARLRRERIVVVATHLALVAVVVLAGGWGLLLRLYVVPVFFVFPIAFTLNRLGQHYDIEPSDPAAWGTVIRPSAVWDFLFLWSSYHVEHHWFPNVPFYNLPALHRELRPLFAGHRMRVRGYGGLVWDWFVRNRSPHLNWE